MCRDHPRVGGEKGSLLVSMYHPGGSPPRGRGKVPRWGYTLYRHRDHPRVGGEKLEKLVKGALLIGSPPRRRGKEVADEGIGGIIRITPAWAGKRSQPVPPSTPRVDHPRVGGEKSKMHSFSTCWTGSPPRGRGKGLQDRLARQPQGITPAWAGKRESLSRCSSFTWDHPRVGGEKKAFRPATGRPLGSPPRGRGKVSSVSMCTRSPGITPAWAGKRSCCASRSRSLKDHPRVGGEKLTSLPKIQPALGSPPRGRGKGPTGQRPLLETRITPAWAGKRQRPAIGCISPWDHPRVGGEKRLHEASFCRVRGSPPRGRGKDAIQRHTACCTGITPAWAGKS